MVTVTMVTVIYNGNSNNGNSNCGSFPEIRNKCMEVGANAPHPLNNNEEDPFLSVNMKP